MRGGAQAQLMQCGDDNLYVVKFQNNPQHLRVLANEFLGCGLAREVGLTVPKAALIEVSRCLIECTPELYVDLGKSRIKFDAGLCFGSAFAGGLMPGHAVDFLPEEQMLHLRNRQEFAGILAIDKWLGNVDGRQVVFTREGREKRYMARFIDFGYCFMSSSGVNPIWAFSDAPLRGVHPRNDVYKWITGWDSFEPWLSRIESLSADAIWAIASAVPVEWYGWNACEMEWLVGKLLERRKLVRDLIEDFGHSTRSPFPNWAAMSRTSITGHFNPFGPASCLPTWLCVPKWTGAFGN